MGNQQWSMQQRALEDSSKSPSKKKFTRLSNDQNSAKSKSRSPEVPKKVTTKHIQNTSDKKSRSKKRSPVVPAASKPVTVQTSTFLQNVSGTGRSTTRTAAKGQSSALLLRAGPGLLQRAQKVDRTAGGLPITTGQVSELFTIAEQAEKAVSPHTPAKIRYLLSEPFNQLSVVSEHLGLTGVGGLVLERIAQFTRPLRCIINVTYEAPIFRLDNVQTYRVPVADDKKEDISIYFDEVADKLEQTRLADGVAIVHCMGGVSRSASFVMAYLIRHRNKSLEEAFHQVKRIRSIVIPNVSFLQQLTIYEGKVRPDCECTRWRSHCRNGVDRTLPEFIIDHYIHDYRREFENKEN